MTLRTNTETKERVIENEETTQKRVKKERMNYSRKSDGGMIRPRTERN